MKPSYDIPDLLTPATFSISTISSSHTFSPIFYTTVSDHIIREYKYINYQHYTSDVSHAEFSFMACIKTERSCKFRVDVGIVS